MSDEQNDHEQGNDEGDNGAPFGGEPSTAPEQHRRWRRPEDRFPALPGEQPPTAPLKEPPRRRPAPRDPAQAGRDRARNLIALVFLLASVAAIAYFAFIWQNPYSALNPLAPPTPLPVVITATYTPTATWTPAPTLPPSDTPTPSPLPSIAPTLTFTPIFLEGFSTPQGTPVPPDQQGSFPFSLQRGKVLYLTNPDARGGCNWSSIAGSVTNFAGDALNGYSVRIAGNGVDKKMVTGSAPGFGPGGFELPLGNKAQDAQFVAELLDPSGTPVSAVYTVETNSDCQYNIAVLRFVQTAPPS